MRKKIFGLKYLKKINSNSHSGSDCGCKDYCVQIEKTHDGTSCGGVDIICA